MTGRFQVQQPDEGRTDPKWGWARPTALVSSAALATLAAFHAVLDMRGGDGVTLLLALMAFGTLLARNQVARRLALCAGIWGLIQASVSLLFGAPFGWDLRIASLVAGAVLSVAGAVLWPRNASS